MFEITEAWLKANATNGVGWTRKQLEILGVLWPPSGGWLKSRLGKSITLEQKERFETLGEQRRSKVGKAESWRGELQALVELARQRYPYLKSLRQGKILRRIAKSLHRQKPVLFIEKIEMMKEFMQLPDFDPSTVVLPEKPAPKPKKKKQKRRPGYWNDAFYDSREWKELRYKAIKLHGRKCGACGQTEGVMHVDHVKPRSKFPALALTLSNLQVLCEDCNLGKGAWDQTDWRKPESNAVFFVELDDPDRQGTKPN